MSGPKFAFEVFKEGYDNGRVDITLFRQSILSMVKLATSPVRMPGSDKHRVMA
jgi:hypothetical protein